MRWRILDRAVEIGVLEHQERRLAAKLQRQLLAGSRRGPPENPPHLGRARERELADLRMHGQGSARLVVAEHDVENAFRQADPLAHLGKEHCSRRREFSGFEHDGVAHRQRRRNLPGQHQ
jgi:ParB family chromosome partitioning protein